jgi:hypothetical protein
VCFRSESALLAFGAERRIGDCRARSAVFDSIGVAALVQW